MGLPFDKNGTPVLAGKSHFTVGAHGGARMLHPPKEKESLWGRLREHDPEKENGRGFPESWSGSGGDGFGGLGGGVNPTR
jgi:hypothetical protein